MGVHADRSCVRSALFVHIAQGHIFAVFSSHHTYGCSVPFRLDSDIAPLGNAPSRSQPHFRSHSRSNGGSTVRSGSRFFVPDCTTHSACSQDMVVAHACVFGACGIRFLRLSRHSRHDVYPAGVVYKGETFRTNVPAFAFLNYFGRHK